VRKKSAPKTGKVKDRRLKKEERNSKTKAKSKGGNKYC
jgi:hypothetical protein